MKNKAIFFLVALVATVLAEGEKKTNPIINFFEAPLKAFRTKPGEAIAVFEPQLLKVATNTSSTSWFPGQGIGNTITDWIAQRVPLVATTTTKPESNIIVHLQSEGNDDKEQYANKEKARKQQAKSPVNGKNDDDDDQIEEAEYEEDFGDDEIGNRQIHGLRYDARYGYPYSYSGPPARKRIRISIRNKNKSKNRHRYGQRYGVPNQSSSNYADDDYDSYEDSRPHRPHRRKTHRRRPERPLPQSDFLQPFQDLPAMTRPIRYGENYMGVNGMNPMTGMNSMNGINPINNQMAGYSAIGFPPMGSLSGVNGLQGIGGVSGMNGLPGMIGIQGMGPMQGLGGFGGLGGLGGHGDNNQIQLLYPSQINGQIPLLIPIQSIPLEESSSGGGGSKKKKKNEEEEPPSQTIHLHIQASSNEPDGSHLQQASIPSKHDPLGLSLQSLQSLPQPPPQPNYSQMYVPVPMQQLGVQGSGIESIPVQQFLPQVQIVAQHTHKITSEAATPQLMLVHEDTTPLNNKKPQRPANNRPPADDRKKPPTPPYWSGSFPHSDPLSLEDYYNKYDYVKQKQNGERKTSVDDTYDSISPPYLSIGQEDEDESPQGKSAEGRAQYYIPQKYYPLINSDSLLEVSNNGRFLLKSGRGLKLKLKENPKLEPVMIEPDQEDIYPSEEDMENMERSIDTDVAEERMDDALEEVQNIKNVEEMLTDMPKEDSIQDVIKELMDASPLVPAPSETEPSSKKELGTTTQKPASNQDEGEKDDKAEAQDAIQPESTPAEPMPMVAEEPKPTTETFPKHQKSEQNPTIILAEKAQSKSPIELRTNPNQGIKSEVVHEKPNGHFIVKSGVADSSATTKSNQNTNRGSVRFQTPSE